MKYVTLVAKTHRENDKLPQLKIRLGNEITDNIQRYKQDNLMFHKLERVRAPLKTTSTRGKPIINFSVDANFNMKDPQEEIFNYQ